MPEQLEKHPEKMKIDGIEITHAFAAPGASNIIDIINPHTQRGGYSGFTLEQMREREKNPALEIVSLDDFQAAKAKEQDAPITWAETTEEKFTEMLEVLPPAFWREGAFLVGEPMDHHATNGRPRFDAYRHTGGKYLSASRPMTIREMRELLGLATPAPQPLIHKET